MSDRRLMSPEADAHFVRLAENPGRIFNGPNERQGIRLYESEAVESVGLLPDGLQGVVRDKKRKHDARIVADVRTGGIRWSCSCGSRTPCPHALATILEYDDLADYEGYFGGEPRPCRALAPEPVTVVDASPVAAPAPHPGALAPGGAPPALDRVAPGMPEQQVLAWAQQRGVRDLAALPLSVVAPRLALSRDASFHSWGDDRTVAKVIAKGGSSRVYRNEIQPQLAAWLLRVADERALAAEAEQERVARRAVPDDPLCARLFRTLDGIRAGLRQRLPALGPKGPSGSLRLEPDPTALVYERGEERGCNPLVSSTARISFDEAGDKVMITAECECHGRRPERCPALLAAVEGTLDLLSDPGRLAEAQALVRAIQTPPWERALALLDRVLAAPAHAPVDGVLAFKVRDEGRLQVVPCIARPKKRGGLTLRKAKPDELARLDVTRAERHALDLVGHEIELQAAYGRYYRGSQAPVRALLQLQGHPRVFLDTAGTPPLRVTAVDAALHVDRGEGGELSLGVALGPSALSLDEARHLLRTWSDGLAWTLDPRAGVCTIVRAPARLVEAVRAFEGRPPQLATEASPGLYDRLPRLSEAMPVSVAPSLRGEEVPAGATPHVRLTLNPDGGLDVALRVRPLPDARDVVPGDGLPDVFVHRAQGTICAVRDLAAEAHAASALAGRLALPPDPPEPWSWQLHEPEEGLDVLSALGELDAEVVWADERRAAVAAMGLSGARLRVTKDRQWFRLGGEVQTDGGAVPLGELLAAIRDQRRYVRIGDKAWARIGDALREQLAAAAQLATEDGARLSALAAPVIEALEEQGATVEADASFTGVLDRLRAAERSEPGIPEGLCAELRPYQVEGVRWMLRLSRWAPGACLADDMGLGKTVQALAVLLDRAGAGPALVVAPTSVGFNWLREAERFAPGLRVAPFRGRAHLDALEAAEARTVDVVVTSYDLLVRYAEPIGAVRWRTLVLDEAQAIKNPATRRAKAVFGLGAEFTLALSGTPLENHTGELWSLFRAVAPGLLGSQDDFGRRFQGPVERGRDLRVRRALSRLVRPFILRRLKGEVAQELPERTEIRLDVDLSAPERRLYDELRASVLEALAGQAEEPDAGKRRFQVLAALTRLRQLACHPKLLYEETTVGSSKLLALRELVAELREGDHKALVFSQFTGLLALVREALHEDGVRYRYLDGSTPEAARRAEVDAFQRGEADVFLLSLKAGGTGLNLTAADYVIHLDPWWNPAVEDQATDRAHRIGQQRPVTVYRLVARGTVEDGIVAMHADKRELVAAVLEGTGTATTLSADELLAIITQSGADPGADAEDGDGGEDGEGGAPRPVALRALPGGGAGAGAQPGGPAAKGGVAKRPSPLRLVPTPGVAAEAAAPTSAAPTAPKVPAPKAATPKAPPVPEPLPPGPASPGLDTPAGSWDALLAALDRTFAQAAADGRLRESSAKNYERAARRIAKLAAEQGHPATEAGVAAAADAYRQMALSGTGAPRGDASMAVGARKWLLEALGAGG